MVKKQMQFPKPKRQKPTNLHFLTLLRSMLSPIPAFLDLREFNANHQKKKTQKHIIPSSWVTEANYYGLLKQTWNPPRKRNPTSQCRMMRNDYILVVFETRFPDSLSLYIYPLLWQEGQRVKEGGRIYNCTFLFPPTFNC